jgi:hypothetical protein
LLVTLSGGRAATMAMAPTSCPSANCSAVITETTTLSADAAPNGSVTTSVAV